MFNSDESLAERREEQDFVLRLIKQVVRAIAQIAGLRAEGKAEQALAEVHDAYRDLLDLDPFLARFLDGPALARFAGEKGTTAALAELLAEEAYALEGLGAWAESARLKEKSEYLRGFQERG